ncbi:MAG: RNA polymerase sigma factor [Saprospiraceae bacterium]|nr:RNA polymerase sigma factor [Saprospiraceae bacterium]
MKQEKRLIDLCINGDAIAQRALVERYGPYLLTTCRRYAPPTWAPEDILQEAFIKIFLNLKKIDFSKGTPRAYMNRICINIALSKKLKLKRTADIEELKWASEESARIAPAAYSNLQVEELMAMIASLPPTYSDVFNLYVVEGYSHREIGEMLGIGESSSRAYLTRARKSLRKMFKENEGRELHKRSL